MVSGTKVVIGYMLFLIFDQGNHNKKYGRVRVPFTIPYLRCEGAEVAERPARVSPATMLIGYVGYNG